MATGILGVLAHETLCHVLDFLGPMDVYTAARQVNTVLVKQMHTYYWKWRTDTACVAGMRLNAWFGACTGMCRCVSAESWRTQLACTERLHCIGMADGVWNPGAARGNSLSDAKVAWAGPIVDRNLPPKCRHTMVVCRNGDMGVLGNSPHQGWFMHPVHNPNLIGMLQPQFGRQSVRKCVPFGKLFLGVLCGCYMVVVRLSVMPLVYAKWTLGTSVALAVDVAVCDQTQTVFSACTSGVLCVQKYALQDNGAETQGNASVIFMQISQAHEVLPNRSVRMVAMMNAPRTVLARDYNNPRLLQLLRLQGDNTDATVTTMDTHVLEAACSVVQLVPLRCDKGVGVVCERFDDTSRMCWFLASCVGDRLRVQLQAPGWHACPDGRLVDVGPETEHPRLVAGGGMFWPTGDNNTLLVQPGTHHVPRRMLAPWASYE